MTPTPPPAIRLDRLTLARAGQVVLRNISLDIPAGSFIGLFGANGAGKTTLLQAILGEIRPASGQILVQGVPARLGNPALGAMPQAQEALPPAGLSGGAVLAAAASVAGPRDAFGPPWPGRAARAAARAALDLLDAGDLADRPLRSLSGGQRQRVLLAQALLHSPRILLLDEPLIGLDPRRQGELVALIRRLQRSLGLTVMFAAHELNPLLPALDQVLYLGAGQAALGSVDAVCQPAILSRLYGAPVEVLRAGGRIFILGGGAELTCAASHGHDHSHGPSHTHTHPHAHPPVPPA